MSLFPYLLPFPATLSRRLTQRAQTGTPAAGVGRPHPLQAAIRKLSLALTSTLSPCKAQQRQALALRLRAVSAQAGLTRTAASRCSRPASCWASPPGTPAASCRPVGWGYLQATCRCEARLQAPLMVVMGEPQGTGHRTPGTLVSTLAANATGGPTLSPDPHPEGGEGGAG